MPLLALFDVDGTLLMTSDPLAGRALRETLEETFATELPDDPVPRIDHAGQSCQRIARLVLRLVDVPDAEIDRGLASWCSSFAERYVELLAQQRTDSWQAGPDAAEALGRLAASNVRLALLTGNPEPMARARMERLELGGYFPAGQGAFGCDGETRRELFDRALQRGGDWPAAAAVAIGDTLRDVESAHESGLRSIVLRSPKHPEAAREADAACDSLGEVATQLLAWAG